MSPVGPDRRVRGVTFQARELRRCRVTMAAREKTLFGVGLGTIETLLRRIGRADSEAGIRTRLKYLQRMSFPTGSNSGRGRRASYDLDQLLQTLVVFQLIQLGLPPTRSLRTVRTGWVALRGPLAFGWLARGNEELLRRRPVLVIDRSTLDDGREGEDPNEPVSNPFMPVAIGSAVERMTGGTEVVGIVLDPASLAHALAEAVSDTDTAVTVSELDEAFAEYWQAAVGEPLEDWSADETRGDVGEVVPFRIRPEQVAESGRPAA